MQALLEALIEGIGTAVPETWRSLWVWLGVVVVLMAAMIWLWSS